MREDILAPNKELVNYKCALKMHWVLLRDFTFEEYTPTLLQLTDGINIQPVLLKNTVHPLNS